MSSTIVHELAPAQEARTPSAAAEHKHPFLAGLGERVRALRARRGMTRRAVALAADVSERHLANLEYGIGNVSMLVLLQVAGALQCPLAELLGDLKVDVVCTGHQGCTPPPSPSGESPATAMLKDLIARAKS